MTVREIVQEEIGKATGVNRLRAPGGAMSGLLLAAVGADSADADVAHAAVVAQGDDVGVVDAARRTRSWMSAQSPNAPSFRAADDGRFCSRA
jgi:hypothetical protein